MGLEKHRNRIAFGPQRLEARSIDLNTRPIESEKWSIALNTQPHSFVSEETKMFLVRAGWREEK
jgi:hypothetical protein